MLEVLPNEEMNKMETEEIFFRRILGIWTENTASVEVLIVTSTLENTYMAFFRSHHLT